MKPFVILAVTILSLGAQAQTSGFDTTKWQDFARQIMDRSIVGLGELGHGYECINQTKAVLAEALQRHYNFHAIAFESSFTESAVSFLVDTTVEARARNFLYPFWNTTSVRTLLQRFLDKEDQTPLIVGFDVQEDCRYAHFSQFLLNRQLVVKNKTRLLACDSILSYYIGNHFSRKGALTAEEYALLIHHYEMVQAEVREKEEEPVRRKLLERCMDNRKWLCKYLSLMSVKEKMYYRDSLMAENIAWLKTELYPDQKLLLWAANTHIAKPVDSKAPQWMGEWLSFNYKEAYFAIGFDKGALPELFFWAHTSYQYFSGPAEKFDLIVYLEKLTKIKAEEWITPCD